MTTMATKVKLADLPKLPDGSPSALTITVTECVEVDGNYGPQARITGTNDSTDDGEMVTIYEKLDAVNRQLGRIGLSIADVVGRTLSFWKEEATNGAGQTFPALRIAGVAHDTPVAAPVAKAAAPASRTARQPISDGGPLPFEETGAPPDRVPAQIIAADTMLRDIAKDYTACLNQAGLIAIAAKLDKWNGDLVGAVTAIAATLFIEKNKRARA